MINNYSEKAKPSEMMGRKVTGFEKSGRTARIGSLATFFVEIKHSLHKKSNFPDRQSGKIDLRLR